MPIVEFEKPKHTLSPRVKLGGTVLVLLIVAGAGWGFWQWRLGLDTTAYKQAVQDDKKFRGFRRPELAVAQWEKYRARFPPRNHLYDADLYEGALLQSMRDYPNALRIYRDAETHLKGAGTGVFEGIASISERQGDYPMALAYYTKLEAYYARENPRSPEAGWMKNHVEQLKKMVDHDAS